jgi:hypothetical protein
MALGVEAVQVHPLVTLSLTLVCPTWPWTLLMIR